MSDIRRQRRSLKLSRECLKGKPCFKRQDLILCEYYIKRDKSEGLTVHIKNRSSVVPHA